MSYTHITHHDTHRTMATTLPATVTLTSIQLHNTVLGPNSFLHISNPFCQQQLPLSFKSRGPWRCPIYIYIYTHIQPDQSALISEEYAMYTQCIRNVYTMYTQCICNVYTLYTQCIHTVYTVILSISRKHGW